jgi:arylsulfatase A-like enzyme
VKHPFGLIDLSPTLLDVLKIPAPASFGGHSCWQKLTTGEAWNRPVFTECAGGCSNPFRAEKRLAPRLLAVRKGDYKLVIDFAAGTDELFELSSDPGEAHPLRSASDARKHLMECAKKHITEAQDTRNLDLRLAAQVRELRAEWAQTSTSRPN